MKCSRTAPSAASSRTSLSAISTGDVYNEGTAHSNPFKIQKKIHARPAIETPGTRATGQSVPAGRIIRQSGPALPARFTFDSFAIDQTITSDYSNPGSNEIIDFEFV